MRRAPLLACLSLGALGAFGALGALGCSCGADRVAELVAREGEVDRDRASELEAWRRAEVGATFALGDGVRVGAGSHAELRLGATGRAGLLRLEENTTIRFSSEPGAQGAARIDLGMGAAVIETEGEGFELSTRFGAARIEGGSRARVTAEGDRMRLSVSIGRALLDEEVVEAGETVRLAFGGAVIEEAPEGGEAATEGETESGGEEQGEAESGGEEQGGGAQAPAQAEEGDPAASSELAHGARGPERVDFLIDGGGELVIHDPRPPTAVGIRFGAGCPGAGVVELMRGDQVRSSWSGVGAANLSLPRGSHHYRVRCEGPEGLGEASAEGTLRVLRDPGVTALPPSAPTTFIDTDGRTYRVMYQTRLPEMVVRWRRAPSAGPYVLTVRGRGAPRTFRSAQPRVSIASGALHSGSYRMRFSAGREQSRETPVEIRFDNAMSTATIRGPDEGGFSPGERVTVEGIAVAGWRAFVGSRELELANGLRFSTTVTAPTATDALVIELRHATRGRHLYLRRARGRR